MFSRWNFAELEWALCAPDLTSLPELHFTIAFSQMQEKNWDKLSFPLKIVCMELYCGV